MDTKTVEKICKEMLVKRKLPKSDSSVVTNGSCVKPNTSKPWVSVEIECFFISSYKRGQDYFDWFKVVASAVGKAGLKNFVRLKDDGSIEPHRDGSRDLDWEGTGIEVVVSAPESKIFDVLEKVCVILNTLGAKTNRSCGLHVHLDHRLEVNRNPLFSYNNLFYIQDLMFKISKPHRKNCGYCDKVSSNNLFSSDWGDYQDNRHCSINSSAMGCHQTIEVRVFHGTTDFEEISHFIKLVLGAISLKSPLKSKIKASNVNLLKSVPISTRRFISSKLSTHKRKKAA